MLSRTLVRTSLRDLLRRRWQAALMVLGVALGVAVVVAIDLANTSATRAFELSTEAVVGRATHQIRGGPNGVPVSLYRQLRLQGDVQASAPVVEGVVFVPEFGDLPLRVLGVDPLVEAPFRSYLTNEAQIVEGFGQLYIVPGAAVFSESFASANGLQLGDRLPVLVAGLPASLLVFGILSPGDSGAQTLAEDVVLMDVAAAQQLFNQADTLTRIDLIASEEQATLLRTSLPNSVRLAAASEQSETASQLTDAFQLNLTALSLLALVVGVFLIYNTTLFSVVQRRRVFGILRAIGVQPDRLFLLIVVEATAVAALGSALGIALGWILGQGAIRLVSQTINDLYFVISVREAPLTAGIAAKAGVLGLAAGGLAAIGPALEAARVAPVDVLRRSSLEQRAREWLPSVSLTGAALALAGGLVLVGLTDSLIFSFAGMFAVLIGLALLVPLLTVLILAALHAPLESRAGSVTRMAIRAVTRELSRTSVAIAALMVALAVTIGVGIMIDSFRSTVENWLDLTLRADLYIAAPALGGTRPTSTLSADLQQEVMMTEGVEEVETFRSVDVESEFGQVQLSVADARRERDAALYRFARGSPAQVWAQVRAGAVIVSEPFAYRYGVPSSGGELRLETDQGTQTFPVVGIYYDYSTERGAILMSDEVYRRYWEDDGISSLAVYLARGADAMQVQGRLRNLLQGTGLQVQANRALREEALRIFDRTFAITAALRILAVVVAFIGVLSSILALQLERRRELATLQALGLPLRGLWRMTLLETSVMGGIAGLLSVPTGLVLALVLIYVINLRSFGWTIQMDLAPSILVQAVIVGILAAGAAAIYPMRRLARMEIIEALRLE